MIGWFGLSVAFRPNEREFDWWSLLDLLLLAICLIAIFLIMLRRAKMILCCLRLLCALSSSDSPLALAVPKLPQLAQPIRDVVSEVMVVLRGRIWSIQETIHETSLQTIQINVSLLGSDGAHDIYRFTWESPVVRAIGCWAGEYDIREGRHDSLGATLSHEIALKVKLIRFTVISMEEDDCLGSGVVNPNYLCCLHISKRTYLISNFSLRTRVSRWNFFCWVILLYLL